MDRRLDRRDPGASISENARFEFLGHWHRHRRVCPHRRHDQAPRTGAGGGRGENGSSGQGLGLANVKARLRLHFGADHEFSIRQLPKDKVQVTIVFPLKMSDSQEEQITRFGEE